MHHVLDFLLWIDQSRVRYWTLGLTVYCALVALCLLPAMPASAGGGWPRRLRQVLGSDALFAVFIGLAIAAFRWPFYFAPISLNPDEAAFISQALTLRHDPVFWRSISSGTSGPLNVFPLLVPWLLGFRMHYFEARMVALCCMTVALACLYLTCRRVAPATWARLAVLPPVTFFALVTHPDFLHYASEYVPLCLLAAAFALAMRLSEARYRLGRLAFAAGCLLGAVPMAKLQGAIIALTIAAFAYLFLLGRRDLPARARWTACAWLSVGGLSVPAVLLAITAAGGALPQFWQSYILANRQYGHAGFSVMRLLGQAPILHIHAQAFYPFFGSMVAVGGMALAASLAVGGRTLRWNAQTRCVAMASAVLAVAWFSVLGTGWPWTHYLLFLVIPVVTWAFAAAALFLDAAGPRVRVWALLAVPLLWCGVGVGWQVLTFPQFGKRPVGYLRRMLDEPPSPIATTIQKYASPDEPLSVWGWYFNLHVETGMGRATSDNYFDYMRVYGGVVPEYFRDLYMKDLRRSNPPVFVDAVAPGFFKFGDRASAGYETFPPLAEYIQRNFTLVEEIRGVRIFVRNDRLGRAPAAPPAAPAPATAEGRSRSPDYHDLRYALKTLDHELNKNEKTAAAITAYEKARASGAGSAESPVREGP